MTKAWIKESGSCGTTEMLNILVEKKPALSFGKYIAMYTDRFESGKTDAIDNEILLNDLLEARFFTEKRELLITRGGIGEEFMWRYIDDQEKPSDSYSTYITYQMIDIDGDNSYKSDDGFFSILSSVKGRYLLPIDNEKRIKIVTYVDYDENGMAFASDNRVCGFVM